MSLVALQPELLERNFASNLEATPDGNYRVQLFKQVSLQTLASILYRNIALDTRQPMLYHHSARCFFFL